MEYSGINLHQMEAREAMPGFHGRFFHTDEMTVAYWEIDAGSTLPEHAHPHRQVVQVQSGEFQMRIGLEDHVFGPGSVVEIPANVPHSGRALTDCVIHDIFLPVREIYKF